MNSRWLMISVYMKKEQIIIVPVPMILPMSICPYTPVMVNLN